MTAVSEENVASGGSVEGVSRAGPFLATQRMRIGKIGVENLSALALSFRPDQHSLIYRDVW